MPDSRDFTINSDSNEPNMDIEQNDNKKDALKEQIEAAHYNRLFQEANMYMYEGMSKLDYTILSKAEKLYDKIIESNLKLPCISGCYANLGEIKYHRLFEKALSGASKKDGEFILVLKKEEALESCFKKALEIEPANQAALADYSTYLFNAWEFDKAFECFESITDKVQMDRALGSFESTLFNFYLYAKYNSINKLKDKTRIEFYKKLFNKIKDIHRQHSIHIGYLLIQYLRLDNQLLEAYDVAKHIIESMPETYLGYALAVELCMKGSLDSPNELIEYAEKGLEAIDRAYLSSNREIKERLSEAKTSITSNLAVAYNTSGRYNEAIEILEKQVSALPNNRDYHNLAEAYYHAKEYEKAYDRISCALYIFENEACLYLAGKVCLGLGRLKEAAEFIKRSIAFSERYNSGQLIDKYDELVLCYIKSKDLTSAYAANKLALKIWEDLERFARNEIILGSLIDMKEEKEHINQRLKEIEEEKEFYKAGEVKMRAWASDLIKLQSTGNHGYRIEDSKDYWRWFESNMDSILARMKEDAKDSNVSYKSIESELKKKYSKLNSKALACLSSGEYLYQVYKDNIIDFAPIVVEYTKVFEIELNSILNPSSSKMLKELADYTGKVSKVKNSNFTTHLGRVIEIRNGSAHTGLSPLKKLEELRDIIFKDDCLDYMLSLK